MTIKCVPISDNYAEDKSNQALDKITYTYVLYTFSGDPKTSSTKDMSPAELINDTSSGVKVIISVTLPHMTNADHIRTIKVAERAQNAHTYVSGGFWVRLDHNGEITGKPSIVFTGINTTFVSI